MSYELKLTKGLSYKGIVSATKKKPYVTVEDKETADKAIATGYFKLVGEGAPAGGDSTGSDDGIPDGIIDDTAGDTGSEEPGDDGDEDGSSAGKTIDEMTVAELETFATYKEVSLKGIRGKENIIAKLREELGDDAISGVIEYGSPTMTELQEQ